MTSEPVNKESLDCDIPRDPRSPLLSPPFLQHRLSRGLAPKIPELSVMFNIDRHGTTFLGTLDTHLITSSHHRWLIGSHRIYRRYRIYRIFDPRNPGGPGIDTILSIFDRIWMVLGVGNVLDRSVLRFCPFWWCRCARSSHGEPRQTKNVSNLGDGHGNGHGHGHGMPMGPWAPDY